MTLLHALQVPPVINLGLFERVSSALPREQSGFLDAAKAYIREAYDADELVQFAQRRKREGGPDEEVLDYVDRALAAASRAAVQLQKILALLPPTGTATRAGGDGPPLKPADMARILAPRTS